MTKVKKPMAPMNKTSVENISDLIIYLELAGIPTYADDLLKMTNLGDDIANYFELIREGRDSGRLLISEEDGRPILSVKNNED